MLVSLERLAAAYRGALGEWVSRVLLAVLFACLVAAGLVARQGTAAPRVAAAAALIVTFVGAWLVWRREGRARHSDEDVIQKVLVPAQHELGQRVLRAAKLAAKRPVATAGELSEGESTELARLHYERLLGRFDVTAVVDFAKQRARRLRWVYWGVVGAALGTLGFAPFHVAEGLNVLCARAGRAPFEMEWLERTLVYSQPPAYLGPHPTQLMMQSASALPEGSVISIRALPLRQDRQLVLSDGAKEVPFANDGSGAQVAHWPVESSSTLRVAARFGEVLIFSADVLEVHSQPDEVPRVLLEGAPGAVDLASMERLELRWRASDDHALAQVDLVLRSGGKEERRPLEHFPSDQTFGEGGHVLFPSDPFLQRIFLPVTVRVEARDNDSRAGSKWGASESFTLRPTIPGSPEAQRYRGISSVRDNLVRFLGQQRVPPPDVPRHEHRTAQFQALQRLESDSLSALSRTYAGLDVPRGWVPFARAQFQRLRRAFNSGAEELRTTEGVVLAIDSGLNSLATRDATDVAKRLGDVADEAAFGAHLAQQAESDRASGRERLDLAISVLQQGAVELQSLGVLGRDLGSVALADLGRVTRSVETSDYFHAELAALHLAARLHRPTPSFSSKGGGGVESGPSQSGESGEGESGEGASNADSDFDRLAQDLEQLAQEHADGLERTARALEEAKRGLDNDALAGEARRRAEALRRSVMPLPQPGEDPGTSGASAALAREHAGAMAHELERLALDRAVENGSRARAAAEEALRRGDLDSETAELLRSFLQDLEGNLRWTEEQLKQREAATEQAARASLSELSKLERELSERARRLAAEEPDVNRSNKPEAALPDEARARLRSASRLMDEAVRALEAGKGEQAVSHQREAQRLLEESETGKTDEPSESTPTQQAQPQRPGSGGGDVPSADRRNSAQDFRERVLNGLGKRGTSPLSGAIKRYAEGLLR